MNYMDLMAVLMGKIPGSDDDTPTLTYLLDVESELTCVYERVIKTGLYRSSTDRVDAFYDKIQKSADGDSKTMVEIA